MAKQAAAAGWGREERRQQRGRCVIADIPLQGGEVVLREAPWAAVLAKAEAASRCDYSFVGGDELLRCPTTGLKFRSQQERQRARAEYYQCERLAREQLSQAGRDLSDLPSTVRLALRVLWRAANSQGADGGIPWLGMEDHWHQLEEKRQSELRCMGELCVGTLRHGLSEQAAHVPDALSVARLLAAISVNAICITDEELHDIGLGFYLRASAFNHSEEPNCVQSFEGRELVVRARVPIKRGDELTITYAELAEASHFRRDELRAQYHFDPVERARGPAAGTAKRDETLGAVLLRRRGAPQKQLDTAMDWSPSHGVVCKEICDDEAVSEAMGWLHQLHGRWCAAQQDEDAMHRLKEYRKMWEHACDADAAAWQLGPGHALRLQLARDGMDLAIELEAWQEAAAWGRAVCSCELLLYPAPWPVPALSQARLAKLELHLGRFTAAQAAGQVALHTLTALGRSDDKVCVELRQMLAVAEAEDRSCRQAFVSQRKSHNKAPPRTQAQVVDKRPVPSPMLLEAPSAPIDLSELD